MHVKRITAWEDVQQNPLMTQLVQHEVLEVLNSLAPPAATQAHDMLMLMMKDVMRRGAEHLFQNQWRLTWKGQSSMGTDFVSTNMAATRMVSTITQMAKKRKVPHCTVNSLVSADQVAKRKVAVAQLAA